MGPACRLIPYSLLATESKRAWGSGGVKKLEGFPGEVLGPSIGTWGIDIHQGNRRLVARVTRYRTFPGLVLEHVFFPLYLVILISAQLKLS